MKTRSGFVLSAVLVAVAVFFVLSLYASGCFASNTKLRLDITVSGQKAGSCYLNTWGERALSFVASATSTLWKQHRPSVVRVAVTLENALIPEGTGSALGAQVKNSDEIPEPFSPFSPGSAASTLLEKVAPPVPVPLPLARAKTERPIKVFIAGVAISSSVSNPASTDISVLDAELNYGAVRYPSTSLLGENGTMIIFGHSSYNKKLRNPAFHTFNDIQNLSPGAVIDVYSATTDYQYAVRDIRVMDAADASANRIPLLSDGQYLVIVTCDSFASKSSRFVVTADFARALPL